MATWNKTKVNASDVNNGNQFNAGDGLRNTDVNKIFESGLYSQDVVENIGIGTVTTGEPGSSAKASVTYDSTTGYPKINLTLPRGTTGPQGEPGSVGTLSEVLIGKNASVTINYTTTFNKQYSYFILYHNGASCIVDNNTSSASFVYTNGSNEVEYTNIRFEITTLTTTTTFKITSANIMTIRYDEEGTINRETYSYTNGTFYGIGLVGVNFVL